MGVIQLSAKTVFCPFYEENLCCAFVQETVEDREQCDRV